MNTGNSPPTVAPQSAEMMLELANYIERARTLYLNSFGTPLAAVNRAALESVLWDDKGTFIQALRLAARAPPPADGRLAEVLEPFAKAADNYADCKDERYIDDDAMVSVGNLRDARAALVSGEGKARKIPELRELLRKASRAISNQPFCGDLREFSELASAPDLIALFVVLASGAGK